ncbi:unnamed protein product [Linum trigynum]|uniref:Uncharacterized protein n=1 Tax=Linum trigynum TaxID=586398 RepID=A0AAV2EN40_9ROSI
MITGFFRGGGGWRNGSTCEMAVKQLQSRLRNLKKETEKRVQDRTGRIARFVDDGDVGAAEQIVRDENAIRILELLYHSCDVVKANLTYIRRHVDCPREINKAVSTLAFASSTTMRRRMRRVSRVSVEVALTRKWRRGWSRGMLGFLILPRLQRFVRYFTRTLELATRN